MIKAVLSAGKIVLPPLHSPQKAVGPLLGNDDRLALLDWNLSDARKGGNLLRDRL